MILENAIEDQGKIFKNQEGSEKLNIRIERMLEI